MLRRLSWVPTRSCAIPKDANQNIVDCSALAAALTSDGSAVVGAVDQRDGAEIDETLMVAGARQPS